MSIPTQSRADSSPEAPAEPSHHSRRSRSGSLRPTLYRLHGWAGVLVAPFLFAAALTGLLYALAPSLEQAAYRDVLTTQNTGEHIPVAQAVEVAQRVHPDLELAGARISDRPEATYRILFSDPALPQSYLQAVFVDPVSGEVLGDMPQYGSSNSLPLRSSLSNGHANLWLGEPGRFYSELAASWLGAMTITGAFLLFQRWRRSTSKKNRPRRWHSLIGLACIPGFLFLTITGLTWSATAGGTIGDIRTHFDWRAPAPDTTAVSSAPFYPTSIDTAIDAARQAGLTGLLHVTAPEEGTVWAVSESSSQPWVFAYDAVAVDGSTGGIVESIDFASWPLAAKLTEWLIRAHMGLLLGVLNQVVLAALALGLMASVVLGYVMWWRRGKGSSFGRLPAPRSWENVPRPALICFLVIMVAYGVFAPYFGLSLLLFLGVDTAWRAFRRRRTRPLH
ncbi:PepSY-associated TM helix domain-containing protein [Corynebacterium lowii]|uniref:PepSY domain-containing protein n=1 Tax=Corynebacterium lowii TaxID=1544413 RepID=A0A0N8VZU2_9CORY|nr:PepSY domain-containing protein [Corynebacterium lowii]KQB84850.1 hypothetical protein Clow_02112 [Corynebacterium lowii]MDP9851754.1 putative iron-regulated membrane protein [Corynebacterium lowii]